MSDVFELKMAPETVFRRSIDSGHRRVRKRLPVHFLTSSIFLEFVLQECRGEAQWFLKPFSCSHLNNLPSGQESRKLLAISASLVARAPQRAPNIT